MVLPLWSLHSKAQKKMHSKQIEYDLHRLLDTGKGVLGVLRRKFGGSL